MRYPQEWKDKGVRVVRGREVYHRDPFTRADLFLGTIASRRAEGATTPGGMRTNLVWTAELPSGETSDHCSMTYAIAHLLREGMAHDLS